MEQSDERSAFDAYEHGIASAYKREAREHVDFQAWRENIQQELASNVKTGQDVNQENRFYNACYFEGVLAGIKDLESSPARIAVWTIET